MVLGKFKSHVYLVFSSGIEAEFKTCENPHRV